ncbi:sulfated surface glycoprotein 185-like [Numida meleagris]|uniref:sulfated surface glycoprotein 185-like n=1 Tax=Numida meleagris TaxID=8996 RepID=UPI000B3E0DF6|nr:sulfated surface glycoprotein 185-like [Numida meleagris]
MQPTIPRLPGSRRTASSTGQRRSPLRSAPLRSGYLAVAGGSPLRAAAADCGTPRPPPGPAPGAPRTRPAPPGAGAPRPAPRPVPGAAPFPPPPFKRAAVKRPSPLATRFRPSTRCRKSPITITW